MGAFFAVSTKGPADKAGRLADDLDNSLRRQEFPAGSRFSTDSHHFGVYAKFNGTGGELVRLAGDDFIFTTGTLLYKGRRGLPALHLLHADFVGQAPQWRDFHGQYCVVLRKSGRTWLLTDPLGVYKVYADSRTGALSSSFLAVAESAGGIRPATQEIYEYVFQGATYGGRTVVEEITSLGSGGPHDLGEPIQSASIDRVSYDGMIAAQPDSCGVMERNLDNLRSYFAIVTREFGGRIDTALSGGYDSRLILALLRANGVVPRVHVYGPSGARDIQIARSIATRENFPIEIIDKASFAKPSPEQFPDVVHRNFSFFDGVAADGIFDNGSDAATRRDRCANGELMLNGGGGEIFRNFFYLPDRNYSIRQLLWSFYCRFDPSVCTTQFDESAYLASLGCKIRNSIGANSDNLSRRQVEAVYALFRCRFWMGRNNGINNRIGWALTPFIDWSTIWDALDIPISLKNSGMFEARLIRAIDPALAGYMTDYGHTLETDPPAGRRMKDWITRMRPPWVRRYSYRIQHARMPRPRPWHLSPPYLKQVLDGDFPVLRRYIDVANVRDPEQFARICSLEYLFQRLGK